MMEEGNIIKEFCTMQGLL